MAVIKCKMCGGDIDLSSDKTFGTCEYCGSTMTFPKIDSEQRAVAFNRGNHFRRLGEFDKALAIYEEVVKEDNTDAEAHWCCALCRFGIEYVEDPISYEWIPTCHRASFDSFLEDVDYLAALENSDGITRRQYQKDAAKIAEVQRGILATSQNEKPFDVFICYKESDESGNRTIDSTLAQDIYYQLTEQGMRVFFARITLEDKVGTQYEPYIFAALNSAKVMLVIGTCTEYLNAVWVKNEWSRYLILMKADRKRLLIPCYRDMSPYELPEQLSVLQSYDMSKIGFIQDLIRGISKVVNADKIQGTSVKETVIVQNEGGRNLAAIVKRGRFALEDGEWERANDSFEQALNANAEYGEAYFGKILAEYHCTSEEDFVEKRKKMLEYEESVLTALPENTERIDSVVEKYQIPGFFHVYDIKSQFNGFDRSFSSCSSSLAQQLSIQENFFETDKTMKRAVRFATGDFAERLAKIQNDILSFYKQQLEESKQRDEETIEQITKDYEAFLDEREKKVSESHKEIINQLEKDYDAACQEMNTAKSIEDYQKALLSFEKIASFKDSKKKADDCKKICEQIREEEKHLHDEAKAKSKEEVMAQRQREAAVKELNKNLYQKMALIIGGVIVFVILITKIVRLFF